jgi:hypothetical protein
MHRGNQPLLSARSCRQRRQLNLEAMGGRRRLEATWMEVLAPACYPWSQRSATV